jgi:iron complex outermembrane receptor protein
VDDFLVFDAKLSYRLWKDWQASIGVNNITDESYHVSHPYPLRTYLAELKYTF